MLAPIACRRVPCVVGVLLPLLSAACVSTDPERLEVGSVERDRTVVDRVMTSQRAGADRSKPERWGDRYWGTSAPPVRRFESVVARAEWALAHEWSGEGSIRTDAFDVSSEWKLVWRSGNRPADRPLKIEAYRAGGEELVARVSVDGQTQPASLHLHGGGSYYLTVTGEGGGWYVAVEFPSDEVAASR